MPPDAAAMAAAVAARARSVAAINRRFQEAAIDDDVARAGVVVHMPITYALSPGMPWEPAPGTGPGRSTVSCTLLNRDAGSTTIYDHADALCYGWVVSATASAVLCSYHADGCTNIKACAAPPSAQDGCGQLRGLSPAIHSADGVCREGCGPQWCDDLVGSSLSTTLSVAPNLCAHRSLGDMLRAQQGCGWCRETHNEVRRTHAHILLTYRAQSGVHHAAR